jgi:dTDP-4-amino-4,6-dideoxygalactose transaminase
MRIPLHDVKAENAAYAAELQDAFDRVLAGGQFARGQESVSFEAELAQYVGVRHAAGVNSGTDALVLALKALGIGPGDEVITTAFTFFATAEAIMVVGARPVFADIEPTTLCLSPEACEAVVTAQTTAILLVHVFGHCSDADQFSDLCRECNLLLVEDAAQAIGATWRGRKLGSIGAAGTLSFYPTKNLGGLGNGGAVLTNDSELASTVASLQNHGVDSSGRHVRIGRNSRLDELQAAFLRIKLGRLDEKLARRRQIAARYDAELPTGLARIRGAEGCVSNYHQYAIRTEKRDALREFLTQQGIATGDYYRTPVLREPALAPAASHKPQATTILPETEKACCEVLTLPVRPTLADDEQTIVITAVSRFFGG